MSELCMRLVKRTRFFTEYVLQLGKGEESTVIVGSVSQPSVTKFFAYLQRQKWHRQVRDTDYTKVGLIQ